MASPDAATARLVLPAPWWILPLAIAAAWLVPGWRRRPITALPAFVSTLPWWPVPLPPIALLWTGALAWVPIAAAVACAAGAAPLAALGRFTGSSARRQTILAGIFTLALGAVSAWSVDGRVPGGDEPHYLVIAQSLVKDHDLRIENNHRRRDYAAYYPGELQPHYVTRGRDGEIYSIHAPGLPALVSPALALAGYPGVKVFLLLLSAVTGALVWRIGCRAAADHRAAWFAWAAVTGSATFLLHSFAVFPDAPGALIVAAATLAFVRLQQSPERVSSAAVAGAGALLAALPWLHTRFAVLAGGFGLLLGRALVRDRSRTAAARRARAALFLSLPVVSALAWFAFFRSIYGTFNPAAPYGGGAGTRAAYVPGGLLGLLFDQQYGLFMYSPVLSTALVIFARRAGSTARPIGWPVLAVAGAYLCAVATYWLWWAGTPANPARFALAALPVLAIGLADAWASGDPPRRRLLLTLLGISCAISAGVVGVDRGALAWNMRTAEAQWLDWLSPVANLPRGWPSFFWALDPVRLASEAAFAVHAGAWIAVFAGAWVVIRRGGEARKWDAAAWRTATAAWLIVGLSIAVQAGWWLSGVNGLDASRSQTTMLFARGTVWELSALAIRPRPSLERAMQIQGEEPGRLDGPAPWLGVASLPAGTYEVHLDETRPHAGTLLVVGAGASRPIRTLALRPVNRQTVTLSLPVGIADLELVAGDQLSGVAGRARLEPIRLDPTAGVARRVASYGAASLYFLDDYALVEADGFWVGGGSTAEVVLEAAGGRAAAPNVATTLTIQNGGANNTATVRGPGVNWTAALGPFETRTIDIRPGDGLRLAISSTSGFRPSDRGTSDDTRYLGVRVSVPH